MMEVFEEIMLYFEEMYLNCIFGNTYVIFKVGIVSNIYLGDRLF